MYFAVYKVQVVKKDYSPNIDFYDMKIEEVLKEGMCYY